MIGNHNVLIANMGSDGKAATVIGVDLALQLIPEVEFVGPFSGGQGVFVWVWSSQLIVAVSLGESEILEVLYHITLDGLP